MEIRYANSSLYCDYAQYNPDTRDVLVKGNIRIYRDGHLFVGERAVFNLETKTLHAADFHGEFYPFKFAAESFTSLGPKAFQAENATMTTSDSSKPDYYFKARTVRVYPGDRVVFSNALLYVGKTPVFWCPYLYQSLKKDTGLLFVPGYTSGWGAYLLTQYGFPISDNMHGMLHFDLRSRRGAAAGLDLNFKFGDKNESWGKFTSYYADDTSPQTNTTSIPRPVKIDSGRYRVSLQSRTYFTDDIYANVDINKLSDFYYLQDFQPHQFRTDPQPDNIVSLTKWDENYTVTAIARAQVNTFYETTERLPELVLDVKNQQILNSPIYYQGETGFAYLNRAFPSASKSPDGPFFPDYNSLRFDSLNQFLCPNTYFGWLSFTPKVGIRGTYYSKSGDSTLTLGGITSSSSGVSTTPITDQGSLFRTVISAGFDASFKLSRAYDGAQSRTWGLDGIRHVIQPYTDFSCVYSSANPNKILQFDRFIPNTQLAPLDFPQFNSVDSISNWDIWRWGVRNYLQTRRDNQTFTWFELDTYVDLNLQEPNFPGITYKEGTFSNVFNNLRWSPVPWASVRVDSQIPMLDKGFTDIDTYIDFLPTQNLKIDFGHRYINGNPYFNDSSLITFTGYYRVNDNWAVSASEQYELKDSVLESQTYQVHRDLSSWTASLGVVILNNSNSLNKSNLEYGVRLTFTLKDFPQVSAPLAFTPSSSGN